MPLTAATPRDPQFLNPDHDFQTSASEPRGDYLPPKVETAVELPPGGTARTTATQTIAKTGTDWQHDLARTPQPQAFGAFTRLQRRLLATEGRRTVHSRRVPVSRTRSRGKGSGRDRGDLCTMGVTLEGTESALLAADKWPRMRGRRRREPNSEMLQSKHRLRGFAASSIEDGLWTPKYAGMSQGYSTRNACSLPGQISLPQLAPSSAPPGASIAIRS